MISLNTFASQDIDSFACYEEDRKQMILISFRKMHFPQNS